MIRSILSITALLSAWVVTPACSNEADKSPDQLVKEGIREMRTGMASDDEATRQATFDKFMPTEARIAQLFGEEKTKLLWEKMGPALARMRGSTEMYLKDPTAKKELVEIELTDLRTDPESGERFAPVFKMIPESIPAFSAITRFESGAAGSSSYLVIDGSMVFIKGLDSIAEYLDSLK